MTSPSVVTGNNDMETTNMTNEEILAEIERYQAIQKQCPPSSDNWQDASMALGELFNEMARRSA